MSECKKVYGEKVYPHIDAELDKLAALKEKHEDVQLSLFPGERQRSAKQREIDRMFNNYIEWVSETLEIQDNPSIKVQAVFAGVE